MRQFPLGALADRQVSRPKAERQVSGGERPIRFGAGECVSGRSVKLGTAPRRFLGVFAGTQGTAVVPHGGRARLAAPPLLSIVDIQEPIYAEVIK